MIRFAVRKYIGEYSLIGSIGFYWNIVWLDRRRQVMIRFSVPVLLRKYTGGVGYSLIGLEKTSDDKIFRTF